MDKPSRESLSFLAELVGLHVSDERQEQLSQRIQERQEALMKLDDIYQKELEPAVAFSRRGKA